MKIVVRFEDGERDVAVDVGSPDATVADLLAALDTHLGTGVGAAPAVAIDRARVPASARLADAGIEDGATVTPLVPARRDNGVPGGPQAGPDVGGASWWLTAVAGPLTGCRYALLTGRRHVLGRGADVEIPLPDPTVSSDHAVLDHQGDAFRIVDGGSRNGTWAAGATVAAIGRVLQPGDTVRLGATVLRLDGPDPDDRPRTTPSLRAGRRAFNRPPRTARPPDPDPLALPGPPPEPGAPRRLNVAAALAPLAMGLGMIALTGQPRFALFALLSPVVAVATWVGSRRDAARSARRSRSDHDRAVAALAGALADRAAQERRRREQELPDLAEILRRAAAPSVRLWERRPDHDDVLRLRLGSGPVPWEPPVAASREDPDPAVRSVLDDHRRLDDAPVPLDLADGGVVGIVGARGPAVALARSLLCQAAVLHGPADLRVAVHARDGAARDWDWVAWLPHREDEGPLEDGARGDGGTGPAHLLVVDAPQPPVGPDAVARALRSGEVCGIVLAASTDALPASCTTVVEIGDDLGTATIHLPRQARSIEDVATAGATVAQARRCARALARLDDPEAAAGQGSLPRQVRLLDLLGGGDDVEDLVRTAWARPASMSTPIGVAVDGPATIDLDEDGPHALVAGTTGAGKSELLRTLIAGLAARSSPDDVVFVLVDYKGGSTFDGLAGLPHVVGLVTDLDAHLGERALRSLEAELRHRERLLRDAGVEDLAGYRAAGRPAGPLPRLVVVIDEFAAMARELPDLLGALVAVAQRGRSLGVHLVLATQRPRGVVGADVRANTNLRIALRVQEPGESEDVIDRPDAAAIDPATPGRAHVRRGHGRVEAVQTARITGSADPGGVPVHVTELRVGPGPAAGAVPSADMLRGDLVGGAVADAGVANDAPTSTDLGRLVAACAAAHAASGRPAPRRPWLPPLPDHVALTDLPPAGAATDGQLVFALADRPDEQTQVGFGWTPADGHLAVFGTVGAGTTTALLAVAGAAAAAHGPDDLHLYGVDLGGGGLAALTALPHTGGVVSAADAAGQARLWRMLRRELDRRREAGAGPRAGDPPQIVVLVDGLGTLLAEHADPAGAPVLEAVERVMADGPRVGIAVACAAERPAALPLRLGGAVARRVLLRHADPQDLAAEGLRPADLPTFVPGRGVTPDGTVVQVAHPGDLADLAAGLPPAGRRPPAPVGHLPSEIAAAMLPPPLPGPPLQVPVGIADDDLGPATLTLHPGEHLLVAGPPRAGVTSALQLLSSQLRTARPDLLQVALCDPHRSALHGWPSLDAAGSAAGLAEVLEALLHGRGADRAAVVLVDDAPRVADLDGRLAALLEATRPGLHVIAGGRTGDLRAAPGHWIRGVRTSRSGLLLTPDLTVDGDLLGVRLPRRVSVPMPAGRGFAVAGGQARLVQLARPPADPPRGSIAEGTARVDGGAGEAA